VGVLYIVGTPIGNLEDITLRALRVLREVSLIAAEDTRHSRGLLRYFEIDTPLISYHEHSPRSRRAEIIERLEHGGVALISDAGMPGVSDPGRELVRDVVAAGHRVEVVPGPSAVTAAVAVSGLVSSGYIFAGFPPRRARERRQLFRDLLRSGFPLVLFESPHRVLASLRDLAAEHAGVDVAVCREMTKRYEEVFRGTASDALDHFESQAPRGEFVLVIAPVATEPGGGDDDAADTRSMLRERLARGASVSDAVREVQHLTGRSRSDIYREALAIRDDESRPDEPEKEER
jgi:16S rRNA (cytidine1402-2'-O)-methyltransferase